VAGTGSREENASKQKASPDLDSIKAGNALETGMIDAILKGIYRYPVKGLTPEQMPRVALAPGATLPADRMYAIENGPSGFDPAAPGYQPNIEFLMLMRDEKLAALDARFDDQSHVLRVRHDGSAVAGDLRTAEGRAAIEAFFASYCADGLRGPPKILFAPGHSFSDVAKKVVSIINLSSVAALEGAVGAPVNPLRFRGNFLVSGWPAWQELDLVGRELAIGEARLKVVKQIVRCAATNVDPDTAQRDMNIPKTLLQTWGHTDCGIYAEVTAGGEVAAGDQVRLV
jgi:uncharacterized protein